jgi:hypothetical protein
MTCQILLFKSTVYLVRLLERDLGHFFLALIYLPLNEPTFVLPFLCKKMQSVIFNMRWIYLADLHHLCLLPAIFDDLASE